MDTLHISKIDNQQWYISILIILGVVVSVLVLTRLDSQKSRKAAGATKVKDIEIDSRQLKKASEEALVKATEQMTRTYRLTFDAQLKENMNRLDNVFNTNSDKITNEFNNSLTSFQNHYQEMISNSRSKIENYTKDLEAKTNESVASRKQEALNSVDKKINAILMAYLNNSLEGAIDLNNQQDYILEKLEKNKLIISKDINNV